MGLLGRVGMEGVLICDRACYVNEVRIGSDEMCRFAVDVVGDEFYFAALIRVLGHVAVI